MPRLKIRDLATPPHMAGCNLLYAEYKSLLLNAVKISGVPKYLNDFILNTLIEQNCIGYDAITDKWAISYGQGLNENWLPSYMTLVFPNKTAYQRKISYEPNKNGAFLIKGIPAEISLGNIIERAVREIDLCNISIIQNLKATQTPFIAVVRDEDTRLSLQHAIQQKEEGEPAIVVSSDVVEGLKGVAIETPYIVDKVAQYRDAVRDVLLNKLGIMSANINKRERVQVGEVNATVGQCVDYIYLFIDTFNEQMQTYSLPYKMTMNGALEELYAENINENEIKEENEND